MKKIGVLILICLFVFNQTKAQRIKIDSLQKIVNDLPDTSKLQVYYTLGAKFLHISSDSSAMYVVMSLELARKYGNKKVEAQNYSLLGVSEKNKGNYEQAIIYHLKSLKIHEAANDETEMAIAYNDIGILYKSMNRWDEALNYYRKSNELCRKIKLSSGISMTYNNIGTIMKEKSLNNPKYLDSAISYYQLALNEAKKNNNTYDISTCLSNMGEVFIDNKNYDTALSIFRECLQYDKGNEDKYGMALSYLHLGFIYMNLKLPDVAIKYCDSSSKICDDENMRREKLNVLETKSNIKREQHDYEGALKIKDQYIKLKDSIFNEETSKQISELQTKYETAKKEKELSKKELLIQKRNYEIAGIVGGMILLSIVVFLLYNRQQIKQRQAREKAILEAEYNERLRIAKDVHDDLGSGLSKISLMAGRAQTRAAGSIKLGSDIQNISAISKVLLKNINDIGWVSRPEDTTITHLSDRLSDLGKGLSNISSTAEVAQQEATDNATLSNDIQQIASVSKELIDNMRDLIWVLNPENTTLDNLVARLREYCVDYLEGMQVNVVLDFPRQIPVMRISRESQRNIFSTIKEAINNCVKHASASEIKISITTADGILAIAVSDNGKGFDMAHLKGSGNGLRNMKQRIEAVGGTFSINPKLDAGTVISISVPFEKLNLQIKNTTIV